MNIRKKRALRLKKLAEQNEAIEPATATPKEAAAGAKTADMDALAERIAKITTTEATKNTTKKTTKATIKKTKSTKTKTSQ